MLSRQDLLAADCHPIEGEPPMTATQIEEQLAAVPQWHLAKGSIERCYAFGNYYETIAFVNAIAAIAHRADHHPDLAVSYNRCTVRFNTHSVAGISINDFICAAQADALYPCETPTP